MSDPVSPFIVYSLIAALNSLVNQYIGKERQDKQLAAQQEQESLRNQAKAARKNNLSNFDAATIVPI